MKLLNRLWIVLLLPLGGGCGTPLEGTARAQGPSSTARICLADRSGSFRDIAVAVRGCARALTDFDGPGVYYARFIADSSFTPTNHLVTAQLSSSKSCPNIYSLRCRALADSTFVANRRAKAEALAKLRTAAEEAELAARTDITGAIWAASDLYDAVGRTAHSLELVIVSDLIDNVGFADHSAAPKPITPDLAEVSVTVHLLTSANPVATHERRRAFAEQLRSYGATEIRFIPVEVQK